MVIEAQIAKLSPKICPNRDHRIAANRRPAFSTLSLPRISEYQVWEEGSHPQLIEIEAMMRQKLDYIHRNPVKRGYVDLPEHWRYSSARNYAGSEGLIEVVRDW